jgi:hypothetical protein
LYPADLVVIDEFVNFVLNNVVVAIVLMLVMVSIVRSVEVVQLAQLAVMGLRFPWIACDVQF